MSTIDRLKQAAADAGRTGLEPPSAKKKDESALAKNVRSTSASASPDIATPESVVVGVIQVIGTGGQASAVENQVTSTRSAAIDDDSPAERDSVADIEVPLDDVEVPLDDVEVPLDDVEIPVVDVEVTLETAREEATAETDREELDAKKVAGEKVLGKLPTKEQSTKAKDKPRLPTGGKKLEPGDTDGAQAASNGDPPSIPDVDLDVELDVHEVESEDDSDSESSGQISAVDASIPPPPPPDSALLSGRSVSAPTPSSHPGSRPTAPPQSGEPATQPPPPKGGPAAQPPPPKGGPAAQPPPPPAAAPVSRRKRRKAWWEEMFNDDYLRSLPDYSQRQTSKEVDFIEAALGIKAGGMILDLGCGNGRHSVALSARGYQIVGLDLSLPMLARAAELAQKHQQKINFIHGDMRHIAFESTFDGACCYGTSFGYFDDDANIKAIRGIHKALKPRGMLIIDVANRDFLINNQPNMIWFEGDGCVCMEESSFNFITSRLQVKRTLLFEGGRQVEHEFSLRVFSLHELGLILHNAGFRVIEVSGQLHTPGAFFGPDSPQLIILAEKRAE